MDYQRYCISEQAFFKYCLNDFSQLLILEHVINSAMEHKLESFALFINDANLTVNDYSAYEKCYNECTLKNSWDALFICKNERFQLKTKNKKSLSLHKTVQVICLKSCEYERVLYYIDKFRNKTLYNPIMFLSFFMRDIKSISM